MWSEHKLNPLIACQAMSVRPGSHSRVYVDLFATDGNHQCRRYITEASDAFSFSWTGHWLWVHGIYSQCEIIVNKMRADGAGGIVVAPVCEQQQWFHTLRRFSSIVFEVEGERDTLLSRESGYSRGTTVPNFNLVIFVVDNWRRRTVCDVQHFQLRLPFAWASLVRVPRCPFVVREWERLLARHPDDALITRLLRGIVNGVQLGFCGERTITRTCINPSSQRLFSDQLAVVRQKEMSQGWRSGPFPTAPFFNAMASPAGGVMKKFSSKIRAIVNFSWPYDGTSINAQVPEVHVAYLSWDSICALVRAARPNCLFMKFDVVSAYKLVTVECVTGTCNANAWTMDGTSRPCVPLVVLRRWEYATSTEERLSL